MRTVGASIAGVLHDFPHPRAKSLAHVLQCINGDIGFAAFDGTVVGPVHADFIRVALLTIALRFPPAAEGFPKPNSAAASFHVATRYRPSSLSSTVL
jgi:hypothetical protein